MNNKYNTTFVNNSKIRNLDNPFDRIGSGNDTLPQYLASLTHTLLMYHPSIKHTMTVEIGDEVSITVEMHD